MNLSMHNQKLKSYIKSAYEIKMNNTGVFSIPSAMQIKYSELLISSLKETMEGGKINYSIYEVLDTCFRFRMLVEHLELTDIIITEDINYFTLYDEIAIVDLYYGTYSIYTVNVEKNIEMMEREYLQLGSMECNLLTVASNLNITLNKISEIVTDKKKMSGIMKEFSKHMGTLKNTLTEVKAK